MAIAEKRFTFLSKETNLPSSAFGAGKIDDIINTATNELKTIGEDVTKLIKSSLPSLPKSVTGVFSSAKDTFDEYSRDIKSIAGKLTNYKGAPEALVGELAKSLGASSGGGSNAAMTKATMDMLRRCGKGSSYGHGGRPYNLTANCSGGKASLGKYGVGNGCDSSSFSDLLNKLSGGGYGKAFNDISSALRSLMAMSGYGYKLGMCGVFGSLYNSDVFKGMGLTNTEFGKAAGNLLGILGSGKNAKGWIDVAKASTNLFPKLTNPSSLDELMENFEVPEELGEIDQVALMEQLRGGQELYDESWMLNSSGELSFACPNGVSSDYKDLSEVWASNRVFNQSQFDVVPESDDDYITAAVVGMGDTSPNDITEDFDWV